MAIVVFDRSILKRNWKRMNRGPIAKAGNTIRKIARNSIRRAPYSKKANPPGMPPLSRRPGRTPPFKMIYSVPEHLGTRAVIGMVGFGSFNPAPGIQEYGGYARATVFRPVGRRHLKKGGLGGIVYKKVRATIRNAPRPFMRPALRKAVPVLPLMWRDSLHRVI